MSMAPTLPYPKRNRMQDELVRQYDILASGKWQRIVLAWCAFGLCAFYISPALVVFLAIVDTAAELVNLRLLKNLDAVRQPARYRGTLICVMVIESTLGIAAGMIWQVDDPYSKALAAGMVMTAALQLTTVRSIHLPYGLCGIATIAAACLIGIWVHWSGHKDWFGLLITAATATAGLSYSVVAMLSNHELHRTTAKGRAAAWAADAAKSRFLAQMSHELRTPLNAIIGLGQIEASVAANHASRERLDMLVASARGLAVVLDDVLDLSSITDGRLTLRPRAVDVRSELATIVATFRHQAKARGVTLDLDCTPDLPPLAWLDPQRLRQCLINLISNAMKHVRDGGIRVFARANGDQIVIDVIDTGLGIPVPLREVIFEPFRKGDAATPGTGLGLAISRSLARQMGGDLVVLPSDTGAALRLSLDAPVAVAEACPTESGPPDLSGRTILVVDDIATNRLVAASFLKAAGARVIEVDGGDSALGVLMRETVDLVLLDMNMPGLDGVGTFRALRRMNGLAARVPVVAMTADVMPSQREQIEAEGLNGFLPKPLLPEDLYAVLIQHLPA